MCQKCMNDYPPQNQEYQPKGHPWNDPQNLANDPDHNWKPSPPAELTAATTVNAAFPALQLVRPPALGRGDFVALSGAGHHFDHKTLKAGEAAELLKTNIVPTLAGPYEPYIIIDATSIPASQQQQEITQLYDLMDDAQRARTMWLPAGPQNAPTQISQGADQPWIGPEDVDLEGLTIFE